MEIGTETLAKLVAPPVFLCSAERAILTCIVGQNTFDERVSIALHGLVWF